MVFSADHKRTSVFAPSVSKEIQPKVTKLSLNDLRAFVYAYLKAQYKPATLFAVKSARSKNSPPQWERWLRLANRVNTKDNEVWGFEDLELLVSQMEERGLKIRLLEIPLRSLAEGQGSFCQISHSCIRGAYLRTGWLEPLIVKLLTEKALVDQLWQILEQGVHYPGNDFVKPPARRFPFFERKANPESYDAHGWINQEIAHWFRSLTPQDYEIANHLRKLIPNERPAPERADVQELEILRSFLPAQFQRSSSAGSRVDSKVSSYSVELFHKTAKPFYSQNDNTILASLSPQQHHIELEVKMPNKNSRVYQHHEVIECACGQEHEINVLTKVSKSKIGRRYSN
ncbi:hypothetical protein EJ08DRAFT_661811 [Tothia fuscella]|uniref:Uncharacterized protein n=1 Tax=Tothia fuscella TaxID=1048955 RepID=A0A9P4TXI2_9PEZI|nr:hypothetical protein EJ08DRAFT_661811 [Tothia fuscella]